MSEAKNMTLQQIKDSLPRYRYLTPGVDVWREGDELGGLMDWAQVRKFGGVLSFKNPRYVARRPIPDEVLENQAFWILLHRLSPMPVYWSKGGEPYAMYTHHNWLEPEQVEALGGEANCKKQTEAGDLYSKWLGEQLT